MNKGKYDLPSLELRRVETYSPARLHYHIMLNEFDDELDNWHMQGDTYLNGGVKSWLIKKEMVSLLLVSKTNDVNGGIHLCLEENFRTRSSY